MSSLTVRIDPRTHHSLSELAKGSGHSMRDVLARAIEDYRRNKILDEVNEAYAKWRADPKAWQEEMDERALLEGTLMDGLEDD